MVEKRMLTEDTQLAVDYESVSATNPPIKKAVFYHTVSDLTFSNKIWIIKTFDKTIENHIAD